MDTPSPPPAADIRQQVRTALAEDIGSGDVSAGLIAADTTAKAELICRQQAVICGIPWANEILQQLDGSIEADWSVSDGDQVEANTIIAQFSGPAHSLLSAERTLLNFLQTLSATATQTRRFVDAVSAYHCTILDTRKTLPGLRLAQKYAVRGGGGQNHRMGLFDAFLIKENHIRAAGDIAAAIELARQQHPQLSVEVEVENLTELEQALAAKPDRILLDNFALSSLQAAVKLTAGRVELEASGGIKLNNVAEIAATGVDYVSLGTLSKDIQAIDFSLLFL